MLHPIASKSVLLALVLSVSGGFETSAHAGVIPWMYNAVFGPVGSMRGYQAGYGRGGCCNYGPSYSSCSPCGGGCSPCSSGACGYGGGFSGGCASGNCGGIAYGGGCASGNCGVNFTPDASSTNLIPTPDQNITPAPTPANRPSPTYRTDSAPNPTQVKPNLGGGTTQPVQPRTPDGDFSSPTPAPSSIPQNKKSPTGRPNMLDDKDTSAPARPLIDPGKSVVTWKSSSTPERVATRFANSRSVEVTRVGAFPNSRWEAVSVKPAVAKK